MTKTNNLSEFNTISDKLNNLKKSEEKTKQRANTLKRFQNRWENVKGDTGNFISNTRNKASNLASTGLNKSGKALKFTFNKLSNVSKSLSNTINSSIVRRVIQFCISLLLIVLIVILTLFTRSLNSKLKDALYSLIYSLIALYISGFGVFMMMGTNNFSNLVSIGILVIASFLFVMFIKKLMDYFNSLKLDSPYLVKGTLNGKSSSVISQDAKNPNAIIIYPSDNESGGIEFSYVLWIYVDDRTYLKSNQKEFHVLHKGSENIKSNIMAPGIFLDGKNNTLILRMNTLKENKPYEQINVKNLPINKWVHVALTMKQRDMQVFINGRLKEKHILKSIPEQNYGNVYMNLNGGFDGFLSKVQYFRRTLEPLEILSIVQKGPSKNACISTGENPPYLDDDWWLK